jgi:hypothetical protein
VLEAYAELSEQRRMAIEDRDIAVQDKLETNKFLERTIAAAWKQGSDAHGRNYYYNYVTGESRWTPPENWKLKPIDEWVRNVDERGNVYWYHQRTGESSWLPPCSNCSTTAERWCNQCQVAYCVPCFSALHESEGQERGFREHTWVLALTEKEQLQHGEEYCVQCKKRKAQLVCMMCFDPYCTECYNVSHSFGALSLHTAVSYARAKQGWMPVKARTEGENTYYVNGLTGEGTYEKPADLMTQDELLQFNRFKAHRGAAEQLVTTIDKLQFDLEKAKHERDQAWYDMAVAGKASSEKKAELSDYEKHMLALQSSNKGLFSMFNSKKRALYRAQLMNPSVRARGLVQRHEVEKLLQLDKKKPKRN